MKANVGQPFYVYILKCADGSYYVGHTDNLEKRILEHKDGVYHGYTYKRRPVELVFYDVTGTRHEAQEGERRIKGWSRKKKEILINYGWEAMEGICVKLDQIRFFLK